MARPLEPLCAEEIYNSAVAFPDPAERAAYLNAACGNDAELRRRIELLLAARAARGSFLDSQLFTRRDLLGAQSADGVGSHLGPFKLLEEIGEGGMGIVYMAEQIAPVRRRVALKIVKPGMDTRHVMARFEAERQALALMDHPNIARVFDAGTTESGRPYFIMELVRGIPITEYCDRERLSIADRLNLFVLVCRAVQHAHQKGVIHRDLKPSNILVTVIDGIAVPKVIDFGVAKAMIGSLTDCTIFTAFQQFIGTPLYMSPEQADVSGVDVDTRSDIYSLGILLYEILTGSTPIEREIVREAALDELRRIVREVEPPPPSQRLSTLGEAQRSTVSDKRRADPRQLSLSMRGEIDWIVMKALEKDRQRRYESAGDFAADVLRFLSDEPVQACPPSRRYRLTKLFRRNRVAILTTTMVLAALLFGLAVSIWQAVRATTAEQAQYEALQQARLAVDQMYTKVAEDWLEEHGKLSTVQRELLENALTFYETFSSSNESDVDARYDKLQALQRVAGIQIRLGNNVEAEKALLHAVEESESLSEESPERVELHAELLTALAKLAEIYRRIDRPHDAERTLDRAFRELDKLELSAIGEEQLKAKFATALTVLTHEMTAAARLTQSERAISGAKVLWQSLVAESPSDFSYRLGLATVNAHSGERWMLWKTDLLKGEADLSKADALLTALLSERPQEARCRRDLAAVLRNLSVLHGWLKQHKQAIDVARRALSLCEQLASDFPNDPQEQRLYAESLNNLAKLLGESKLGNLHEMSLLSLKARDVLEQLVDRYAHEVEYKTAFLDSVVDVARRAYEQGDVAAAQQSFVGAADKLIEIVKAHPDHLAIIRRIVKCRNFWAAIAIEQGEHERAARILEGYPEACRKFQSSFAIPDQADGMHFPSEKTRFYAQQVDALMTPAILLQECVSLAEQDSALSARQRSQAIDSYRTQADLFLEQATLAIDAWTDLLIGGDDQAAFRVAGQAELRIQSEETAELDESLPRPLRDAYASRDRRMFRCLVQSAAIELANNPTQYWIALVLSAVPPELRSEDLALKMARRSVQLAPEDENARQALGWALFRTGKWDECLEMLGPASFGKDDGPQSIHTMALWKLGRREEALKLHKGSAIRLEEWEKRCSAADKHRVFSLPSAEMQRRLYDEVKAMLKN